MTATSSPSTCGRRQSAVLLGAAGVALGAAVGVALGAAVGILLGPGATARAATAAPRYAVAETTLHLVDRTRTIQLPGHHPVPRPLTVVVRYPAGGRGRFPLIMFAHGFAVTPAYYWRLLRSWTQAGYVVAAPVFPLENKNAPGGPDEADLFNEPRDMSFVTSRLLAASARRSGPLAGLIDPKEIAVSGHSDGAEVALADAEDRTYADRRVRAAVVMSGAEMDAAGSYFRVPARPLLAIQGTADTSNLPHYTYAYWNAAPRPKYLLKLLGAKHLPPVTHEQPQLSIVEHVSTAFFDRYLDRSRGAQAAIDVAGNVPRVATLTARP